MIRTTEGSFTVEAAVILPFLLIIIFQFFSLLFTLEETIERNSTEYIKTITSKNAEKSTNTDILRIYKVGKDQLP